MAVEVRLFTDPASAAAWTAWPALRRLIVEFGDDVRFTLRMGGLARSFEGAHAGAVRASGWRRERLRHAGGPALWTEGPIGSSYPALHGGQGGGGGGRRRRPARCFAPSRRGSCCFRRKLDTTEALVEEARGAGLDAARFRIDLGLERDRERRSATTWRRRAGLEAEAPSARFGDSG